MLLGATEENEGASYSGSGKELGGLSAGNSVAGRECPMAFRRAYVRDPLAPGQQTAYAPALMVIMSPSRTVYCFPSRRQAPAFLQAAKSPYRTKSS